MDGQESAPAEFEYLKQELHEEKLKIFLPVPFHRELLKPFKADHSGWALTEQEQNPLAFVLENGGSTAILEQGHVSQSMQSTAESKLLL